MTQRRQAKRILLAVHGSESSGVADVERVSLVSTALEGMSYTGVPYAYFCPRSLVKTR